MREQKLLERRHKEDCNPDNSTTLLATG
jgi:hypothetical protein